MKFSIKSINKILDLQKIKNPRVHCISGATSNDDLKQAISCYGGQTIISKSEVEAYEITSKSDVLLISLDELYGNIVMAIEKSLKACRKKNLSIILDINGVDLSSYRRETTLSLLNRYNIDIVIGNREEFKSIVKAQNRNNYDNINVDYRGFSRKNRTISIVKEKEYYITDGFSEFFINNGIDEFNKVASVQWILNGMISIGVSIGDTREEKIEAALIAILAFNISEELAYKKTEHNISYGFMKDYLYSEISNITAENIDRYSKIRYNFNRYNKITY